MLNGSMLCSWLTGQARVGRFGVNLTEYAHFAEVTRQRTPIMNLNGLNCLQVRLGGHGW
jgi:hypothetical protein